MLSTNQTDVMSQMWKRFVGTEFPGSEATVHGQYKIKKHQRVLLMMNEK